MFTTTVWVIYFQTTTVVYTDVVYIHINTTLNIDCAFNMHTMYKTNRVQRRATGRRKCLLYGGGGGVSSGGGRRVYIRKYPCAPRLCVVIINDENWTFTEQCVGAAKRNVYARKCVNVYLYVPIYVYVCACVCVWVFVYMNVCTHEAIKNNYIHVEREYEPWRHAENQ